MKSYVYVNQVYPHRTNRMISIMENVAIGETENKKIHDQLDSIHYQTDAFHLKRSLPGAPRTFYKIEIGLYLKLEMQEAAKNMAAEVANIS